MPITWTRPDAAAGLSPAAASPPALDALPSDLSILKTLSAAAPPNLSPAGAVLVDLYHYVRTHAPQHTALAEVIPVLIAAVRQFSSGTGQDPFDGARTVLAAIRRARVVDPSLPA